MSSVIEVAAQTRDPRTYAIIGAAMEVHREMGCGFAEPVYQEAMAFELIDRTIAFEPQVELPVRYKQRTLKCKYRADFICFGEVLVEIKALGQLSGTERAQVINYLKATGLKVALQINFGS